MHVEADPIIISCDAEFYGGRPVSYGKCRILHFGKNYQCVKQLTCRAILASAELRVISVTVTATEAFIFHLLVDQGHITKHFSLTTVFVQCQLSTCYNSIASKPTESV